MNGLYAYTPYIWPPLASAILVVIVGLYSFRRRARPGALPVAMMCFIMFLWSLGSALELAALDAPTRIFWFLLQAACKLPVATAGFCFVLEYADPGRWLNRRTVTLLSFPVLLVLLLIITNDAHHLMYTGFSADPYPQPVRAIGHAASTGYMLLLSGLQLIVLVWLAVRSPQHRWPVALLVIALVASRAAFMFEITNAISAEPLDLTLLSGMVGSLLYALLLFRFHLFDLVPVARATGIEQMQEGMVVLDAQQRIMDLNPAAEKIFSVAARHIRGQSLRALSLSFDLEARLDEPGAMVSHEDAAQSEISLVSGGDARYYAPHVTRLVDRRGVLLGHTVLLYDVTEYKRAQAQIVEHQRALARLEERDVLARELHDDLGQVLGYVKMQAEATRVCLARDQKGQADEHLAQLITMVQEKHTDIREYILGARVTSGPEFRFLSALRQYLRQFQANYRIRTELLAPAELHDEAFEPMVQAQLLRIIQEALTNARKHARAQCVQLRFQCEGGRAQIVIEDDGSGFEPALQAQSEGPHFGLHFMRERAEEVGGSVRIHSAPGQGTQVVVDVPLRG